MYITQYNVFDMLSAVPYRSLIKSDRQFRFQWVSLLSPGEMITLPGRLYVCDPETLRTVSCEDPESICILCVGSFEAVEAGAAGRPLNLIAVEAESPVQMLNMLQASFSTLIRWAYQINSDIAAQADFQTIVSRGRVVFGGLPLLLVNASYNILALSSTDAGGAENLQKLLDQGYYAKDVTDALARRGYFKYSYHYTKPALLNTPNFMGAPVLVASIYSKHQFCGFIALYFTYGRKATEGTKGLFRWFSAKLRDYYLRCIDVETPHGSQKEAFISDLLQQTKPDETYLEDRARALQIPLDMRYRVCVIQWENYSRPQADYVLWRLKHDLGFSSYRALAYQDKLILLMNGDLASITVQQKAQISSRAILDLIEADGGYAGFSLPGFPLLKINAAYHQALSAAACGRKLAPDDRMYFFSRYYLFELMGHYESSFPLEDLGFWRLRELRGEPGDEYDNFHLLRYFLLTERNITETAKLMHMHRNSVIYRLKRIQREFMLDLDDPEVRLRLAVSFRIQELLNGKLEPRPDAGQTFENEDPLFLE